MILFTAAHFYSNSFRTFLQLGFHHNNWKMFGSTSVISLRASFITRIHVTWLEFKIISRFTWKMISIYHPPTPQQSILRWEHF